MGGGGRRRRQPPPTAQTPAQSTRSKAQTRPTTHAKANPVLHLPSPAFLLPPSPCLLCHALACLLCHALLATTTSLMHGYLSWLKQPEGVWRNGSASDSRSEGWEFESLCPHAASSLIRIFPHKLQRADDPCKAYPPSALPCPPSAPSSSPLLPLIGCLALSLPLSTDDPCKGYLPFLLLFALARRTCTTAWAFLRRWSLCWPPISISLSKLLRLLVCFDAISTSFFACNLLGPSIDAIFRGLIAQLVRAYGQ